MYIPMQFSSDVSIQPSPLLPMCMYIVHVVFFRQFSPLLSIMSNPTPGQCRKLGALYNCKYNITSLTTVKLIYMYIHVHVCTCTSLTPVNTCIHVYMCTCKMLSYAWLKVGLTQPAFFFQLHVYTCTCMTDFMGFCMYI